jgi:hypothetical protein
MKQRSLNKEKDPQKIIFLVLKTDDGTGVLLSHIIYQDNENVMLIFYTIE